jgi:thymidylate synthase
MASYTPPALEIIHDIYGAWSPTPLVSLTFSQYVADEVGVEVGTLTIHSYSAHIYQVNFEEPWV